MKNILIAVTLILLVVSVNAKGKSSKIIDTESTVTMVLTGSIADENSGESLVGVEVKIEGTDLKTYTDFDGNFSFKDVKPGEYKLTSSYISYKKNVQVLKVSPKGNEIKIKLQSSK